MYPNLEAEIARKSIKKNQIAKSVGIAYSTFSDKLRGKYEFSLGEAKKIKNEFFPECSIEYLFEKYGGKFN